MIGLGITIACIASFIAGYCWRRWEEVLKEWKPFRYGRSWLEWMRLVLSK